MKALARFRFIFLHPSRFMEATSKYSSSLKEALTGKDETQVGKLHQEQLIVVDENDNAVDSASKLDCHLITNGPPLHRAFSVFLFNTKNELLMQRRSMSKVTFPGYYTNSCCSHPLNNENEKNEEGAIGIKRAAQRRMFDELGVSPDQFPLEKVKYVSRILYKAPCSDIFGEHEVDYVLFAKCDVDIHMNENEVSEITYVSLDGLDDFVKNCNNKNIPLTPWFKLIMKSQLRTWWRDLDCIQKHFNHKTIIKF